MLPSMLTVYRPGRGPVRDVLIAYYLLTSSLSAVAEKRPDLCILVDTATSSDPAHPTARYTKLGDGRGESVLPLDKAIDLAIHCAGPFKAGRVILAGFSGGGQGITAQLNAVPESAWPEAAVVVDGWHCSALKTEKELASRRAFVAAARRGERVLAASHTQIKPPTYTSTRETLEALTGLTLDKAGPVNDPVRTEDHALLIESFTGATGNDHSLQTRVVAARIVLEAMDALDGLGIAGSRDVGPAPLTASTFALRSLEQAEREIAAGVHEVPDGSNSGPRVSQYLARCVRGGIWQDGELVGEHFIGTPAHPFDGAPWCSGAVGLCDEAAARPGDRIPPWRASVYERIVDAKAMGTWHPIGDGYVPQVGDHGVFARDGQEPERGGHGHINWVTLVTLEAGVFATLDPNHNNGWGRVTRNLNDKDLRGFVAKS